MQVTWFKSQTSQHKDVPSSLMAVCFEKQFSLFHELLEIQMIEYSHCPLEKNNEQAVLFFWKFFFNTKLFFYYRTKCKNSLHKFAYTSLKIVQLFQHHKFPFYTVAPECAILSRVFYTLNLKSQKKRWADVGRR